MVHEESDSLWSSETDDSSTTTESESETDPVAATVASGRASDFVSGNATEQPGGSSEHGQDNGTAEQSQGHLESASVGWRKRSWRMISVT